MLELPSEAVCDFDRSFMRWSVDSTARPMLTASHPQTTTLNHVRIPVDCLAQVLGGEKVEEFGLSASCKSERVFVSADVWTQPNADMCAICGSEQFLVIKRWEKTDKRVWLHPPSLGLQPERQCVDPKQAFASYALSLRRQRASQLTSIEAILEVLAGDRRVVARTQFSVDGTEILIEYPVKAVNFSDRHRYYQVDTGPVLFLGPPVGTTLIERFHLAFIAHLGGNWAEFLVCRPTPLDPLPVAVHHYSEVRRVAAKNSLWVLDP